MRLRRRYKTKWASSRAEGGGRGGCCEFCVYDAQSLEISDMKLLVESSSGAGWASPCFCFSMDSIGGSSFLSLSGQRKKRTKERKPPAQSCSALLRFSTAGSSKLASLKQSSCLIRLRSSPHPFGPAGLRMAGELNGILKFEAGARCQVLRFPVAAYARGQVRRFPLFFSMSI